MASVRVRVETGKLFLDFRYLGMRCREQTLLDDTPKNRKQLESVLQRIQAKITLGEFTYADFFPESSNRKKVEAVENGTLEILPDKPTARSSNHKAPAFGIFAEQWFSEKSVEWRSSHLRNVRSLLDSALLPAFGKTPLAQISKDDLMNFRVQQASLPGRNGNATVTAKTVNNRMGILSMIMTEAADRYGFESPYRNIKPLKLQKVHIEPFSLLEVNRIIEKVREDFRNYYTVRFFTGMRTGEVDGLKWEYVDFERRQILVRETLIAGKTEYTKNNGSQREIPMLGPVYEALMSQKSATGRLSRYVFCNMQGEPLDQNNVTKRVWYPLLRNLRLAKRRPYQTRHTAATLLLASGENPEWVARLLGHSSTEMLFTVYSRYVPNLTRMDGSAFENLVAGTSREVAS
ncbi:Arm DNA-binding domain-containing protein [Parathalassolituus penaei]|uniref:DUF3596 domain-containing protein n=1 Tax=Parathalassolituus penaei TaxID=2997323 RepID=A0A9X3EHA1_9GAMM|nr:DUF3596 domain-containing protein [Parathalassolituus penaei]MCY0967166.1 DUF3596 domain-containing protein [Parathalassolituus penaei]